MDDADRLPGFAVGGSVYRRAKGDVRSDMWFDSDYPEYLYPYDYEPTYA